MRRLSREKLVHYLISANLLFSLGRMLPDSDCQVLPSGMLVKVGKASLVAPDVSVVLGKPETEADTRILLNPILLALKLFRRRQPTMTAW